MRKQMSELLWSLDRFHSSNHTDQWCHDNVHPSLPWLKPLLVGVNTSICESVFAWVRNYAGALHTMSRYLGQLLYRKARCKRHHTCGMFACI